MLNFVKPNFLSGLQEDSGRLDAGCRLCFDIVDLSECVCVSKCVCWF